MPFRGSRAALCAVSLSVLALGVGACGGSSSPKAKSATDTASGLTVSVAGDQITLKRSAKSTSGTGGTAGQVACSDDYKRLVTAKATPAPTQPWYAATLIAWPGANKTSTATLSHSLKSDPDLCIAQTSDSSTQVIIYFSAKVKSGVATAQTANARQQQASQAAPALQAGAQAVVATATSGSFPAAAALVQTLSSGGLYAKQATDLSGVTESGTVYLITGKTTKKTVVLALKDTKGTINTATQGVKGSAKLATAKP